MHFVNTEPGIKVAVYDLNPAGKDTVLLIHGWPFDHTMFEYQLDVLPKYGYRCITIDLRGFGQSDAPWFGYSYDRLADDILAVIRSINVPHLTLAGFSMGGPIVIRYMTRHNAFKVSKLALLSAAAPSFTQREGYPYGMTVAQVNAIIDHIYRDRPQAVSDFGKMLFANPITPSFSDWMQSLSLSGTGHATIQTAVSLRDSDLRSDLRHISVPTGIFHGVLDQVCPYEFALELHKGIQNSTLHRFDHSGHAIFYDELEKFNEEFMAFLNC